jgi:hypothetical protein
MPSSDTGSPASLAATVRRLLMFTLPLLVGWAVLELWMQRVPSSHSIKRDNLESLAPQIDTLILGSSSAYWDIAPQYLHGTVYNLANVAQTLYYDDQLATQVLPRLPKLRRVIIAVPYVSMFFQLQGTDEEERQYYYYQEWHIPPPRLRERLDLRMWSAVALRTPSFAVSSLKSALVQLARGGGLTPPPVDPPIDVHGWCPRTPGDPADLGAGVIRTKLDYHHSIMHLSDEAANLAYLEHLLTELSARRIEVIFVTPPVWPVYASGMRADYWDRARTDLQRLSRTYGARYLSFLTLPELTAQDFLDADHLNERGAVRFTRVLNTAIDRSESQVAR